jgi:hypothetical protein
MGSGMPHAAAGLPVYGADNRLIGVAERLDAGGVVVDGRLIPPAAIARVGARRVQLHIGARWVRRLCRRASY